MCVFACIREYPLLYVCVPAYISTGHRHIKQVIAQKKKEPTWTITENNNIYNDVNSSRERNNTTTSNEY